MKILKKHKDSKLWSELYTIDTGNKFNNDKNLSSTKSTKINTNSIIHIYIKK